MAAFHLAGDGLQPGEGGLEAEGLLGLLLLIVAFSLVLMHNEESVNSFEDALWYCFAIVTTIGFGDITAVSVIGRVVSVLLGIYGIVAVAILTSIIVNFYNEIKSTPERDEGKENEPQEERKAAEIPEEGEKTEQAKEDDAENAPAEPEKVNGDDQ